MLKNCKTRQPMPLYMVNVLPTKNFEEIFKFKQIYYISVTIQAFRGHQRVKQCYRCQGYGHISEICNFTPKCCKCGGLHLTPDCEHKGRITPTCANCGQAHPSTYRGCIKNPYRLAIPIKIIYLRRLQLKLAIGRLPRKPNY